MRMVLHTSSTQFRVIRETTATREDFDDLLAWLKSRGFTVLNHGVTDAAVVQHSDPCMKAGCGVLELQPLPEVVYEAIDPKAETIDFREVVLDGEAEYEPHPEVSQETVLIPSFANWRKKEVPT